MTGIEERIGRRVAELKGKRDLAEYFNETEKMKRCDFAIRQLKDVLNENGKKKSKEVS